MMTHYYNSKKVSICKNNVYMITLHDTCQCDLVKYDEEKDCYHIFDERKSRIIERVKNDEKALENIKLAIRDKNLANHLYIDSVSKNVYEYPKVIVHTTKSSDFPDFILYSSSNSTAEAKYNILNAQLKSRDEYIDLY